MTDCCGCFPWPLRTSSRREPGLAAIEPSSLEPRPPPPQRPRQPAWQRLKGLSPLARASSRSSEDKVLAVFRQIARGNEATDVSERAFEEYLCEHLGYGRFEAMSYLRQHQSKRGHLSFQDFRRGYAKLNPFFIINRKSEIIMRKRGSLARQQVNLQQLHGCEVYICDPAAQAFVDFCTDSLVLLCPVEGALCIRDCSSCTFWAAAQQVRVKNCRRCTFHIYAKTPPTLVDCEDLLFAPWTAGYAHCAEQFEAAALDVQRNFWNAVADFSPGPLPRPQCCWRIAPLDEVVCLVVHLDEQDDECSPTYAFALPTHASLCLPPPEIEEQEWQTDLLLAAQHVRPPPPDPPLSFCALRLRVDDVPEPGREIGAAFLNRARSLRQQKLVLDLVSKATPKDPVAAA